MDMETVHPLRAWREKQGLSLRALETLLAGDDPEPLVSYVSLQRIEQGQQPPRWNVIERLYEVSKGELTPNDFIGFFAPERPA